MKIRYTYKAVEPKLLSSEDFYKVVLRTMLNYLSLEVYYFNIDKIFAELQRKLKMIINRFFNFLQKWKELHHRAVITLFENFEGCKLYLKEKWTLESH